jgi:hypothetical protein
MVEHRPSKTGNMSWPLEVAQLSARDRGFALLADNPSRLLP